MTPELQKEVSLLTLARAKALTNLEKALRSPQETFLREHQINMLEALRMFFQSGERAGYLSEPTGVGKSAVMVNVAAAMGLRTVILSPTRQILDQTYRAARRFTPSLSIGNYDGRAKDLSGQVVNTTYQSISNLIDKIPGKTSTNQRINGEFNSNEIELVLCDEAHLGLGEVRHTLYRNFPNALLVGLTATPDFTPLEGFIQRGIVKEDEDWTGLFKNNIHEMTLEEAMEREILTNLEVHLVRTNTQVGEVKIMPNGEYRQSDLEKYFARQSRNALAIAMISGLTSVPEGVQISEAQKGEIANINKRIAGKQTVIFSISINHANELAEELKKRGIVASAVHSKIDPQTRTKILDAHSRGEIQVVLGVDMLRLGWDSPVTEVSIHLRPTRSGVVKVQELGRVLRPSPETGKTGAIAIELVDQMQKRAQSPILIPNIFDPEYVLRGTQTGKAPSETKVARLREKSVITFSGINIETIVEEARSQELLRTRFKQSNVREMGSLFDSIIQEAFAENPQAGIYELCRKVVEILPERMPAEAQHTALQALASIDANTVTLGKRAMLFLNLKTLVSAVDYHANNGDEPDKERDEMIKSAMVAMGDRLQRIKSNIQIAQQIYYPAREAIEIYIADRDKAPLELVKHPQYRQIVSTVASEMQNGLGQLTDTDFENIIKELTDRTGALESDIRDYVSLQRRLQQKPRAQIEEDRDSTFEKAAYDELLEKIKLEVDSLKVHERTAIKMRFGLDFGRPKTFKEIAKAYGAGSLEAGRQMVIKALGKLRNPSRAKQMKWYVQDEALPVTMWNIDRLRPFPQDIHNLNFPDEVERELRRSGIRNVSDFFRAYPEEIAEEWQGKRDTLTTVATRVIIEVTQVINRLNSHSSTPSNIDLLTLKELSDAVLYRDALEAIDYLAGHERLAVAKKLGILETVIAQPRPWIREDQEITTTFLKLSPYEIASAEYQGRKRLVRYACGRFGALIWNSEKPTEIPIETQGTQDC